MVTQLSRGAGERDALPHHAQPSDRSGLPGQVGKVFALGLAVALAVWGMFPLIDAHAWLALAALLAVTALIFYVYLSRRPIPAKYLLPGTLLLIAFQVIPIIYTASTAFTNFGDGHRGSKQNAITAIQTSSVRQIPGSAEYALSVASVGDPTTGRLVFLLLDPASGAVYRGDTSGLHPLDASEVTVSGGRITAVRGYVLLTLGQASIRSKDITGLIVPTQDGAVLANGITRAYEGQATRHYGMRCDCVTDSTTGRVWRAENSTGSFVDADGQQLPQGWKVSVGFDNFTRVVTDSRISGPFLRTLVWNIAFATVSVAVTFILGLLCALALNAEKMRGRRLYRTLLVLPYAMPSFAMLLVWTDMFNEQFGLINRLFGIDVDWLGGTWTARLAVILVQLWLGYPYMFLVSLGALQAIPRDLGDAAIVDGASRWIRFRKITLPLLLVALAPLLISSFAYNFNNFNAIKLTTDGGPFPPSDPTVGATDLLITYTYRLAFGAQGAQYGFAAAISVYIFALVAIISALSFRRARRLEEVYE